MSTTVVAPKNPLNPSVEVHRRPDGREVRLIDRDDLQEVIGTEARGDFEIVGWSYEERPPETYVCLECGGDRFLVGNSPDALLTVLKCPACGWERCVHDG